MCCQRVVHMPSATSRDVSWADWLDGTVSRGLVDGNDLTPLSHSCSPVFLLGAHADVCRYSTSPGNAMLVRSIVRAT